MQYKLTFVTWNFAYGNLNVLHSLYLNFSSHDFFFFLFVFISIKSDFYFFVSGIMIPPTEEIEILLFL